jgi:hypothetical protein
MSNFEFVLGLLTKYKKKQIDFIQIKNYFEINKNHVNIIMKSFHDSTPILYAMTYHLQEVIALFCEPEFHCNFYISNASNSNILHNFFANCKYESNVECIKIILTKTNLNLKRLLKQQNIYNCTPIHYAMRWCNFYIQPYKIRHILLKNSNLNLQETYFGFTPLMLAINENNNENLKIALKYKINLTIRNKKNQTIFDIAQQKSLLTLQILNTKLKVINLNNYCILSNKGYDNYIQWLSKQRLQILTHCI